MSHHTVDRTFVEHMLAMLPANDNGDPNRFRVSLATPKPEDIDRLLALAGYDPERIPVGDRLAALHITWCVEKGVFEAQEIARFAGRSRAYVRYVKQGLRRARRIR